MSDTSEPLRRAHALWASPIIHENIVRLADRSTQIVLLRIDRQTFGVTIRHLHRVAEDLDEYVEHLQLVTNHARYIAYSHAVYRFSKFEPSVTSLIAATVLFPNLRQIGSPEDKQLGWLEWGLNVDTGKRDLDVVDPPNECFSLADGSRLTAWGFSLGLGETLAIPDDWRVVSRRRGQLYMTEDEDYDEWLPVL